MTCNSEADHYPEACHDIHVIHVVNEFCHFGGTETSVANYVMAALESGIDVTVISRTPIGLGNRLRRHLTRSGARFCAPTTTTFSGVQYLLSSIFVCTLVFLRRLFQIGPFRAWERLVGEWSYQRNTYYDRQLVKHLERLAGQHNTVVHCHSANRACMIAVRWAESHRRPVICLWHRELPVGFQEYLRETFLPEDLQVLSRYTLHAALTPAIAEQVQDFCGPGSNVVVWPNWLRVEPGPPKSRRGRSELVIGSLGRLVERKGFEEFIEVVSILRQQGVPVRALIGGDGPLKETLCALAQQANCSDIITFLGPLDQRGVARFFATIDIFVLLSHSEGMPMTLLEAMASGTPYVATAVGGIMDITEDGRNGLLVSLGDTESVVSAIRELAATPDHLEQMSIASMALYERCYREAVCWPRVLTTYRELVCCQNALRPDQKQASL